MKKLVLTVEEVGFLEARESVDHTSKQTMSSEQQGTALAPRPGTSTEEDRSMS